MALGLTVANDIANGLLTLYTRGSTIVQTMQDKPLLAQLNAKKKTFSGGNQFISDPIQGYFMSDQAGFLQGYSEDDQLSFNQAANIIRNSQYWKEVHAGLIISWTELKKDGITIKDHQAQVAHSETEAFKLTDLLDNRMSDFMESLARAKNRMFWLDGSQDPKATPGVKSILTDTADVGVTVGLNRATYAFWRHRVNLNIPVSATDSTLLKFLQDEVIQLMRFGGKPDVAFCGSVFLKALRTELWAKGQQTVTGFQDNKKATSFGMDEISINGIGTFTYDPTLDDLGEANRCYIMDSRRLTLRPMEDEDDKVLTPERPYNYMVFLKDITWTGALCCTQLNCHAVYAVPA